MSKKNIDSIEKRKRKNTRRSLFRLLILMLIAAFCVFLYMERGNWMSGVETKIESIKQNDGVLAEGNFPLTISGNGDYQVKTIEDNLAILNNSYMYIYSVQGENIETRSTSYTNTILKANNGYTLCYENSGIGFRVDRLDNVVYEKEAEDIIISGAVSDEGHTALITESSNYNCSIYIYDENGKKIYTRNCVERVSNISFDNENTGCVFVELNAADGELSSVVKRVNFEEKESLWEAPSISTLCLETSFTSDGRVCVVGDSLCAYYNKKGQLESMYTYTGELLSYDVRNGNAAVLVRNDETRETNLLLFNGTAENPAIVNVNQYSNYVQTDGVSAYLMSNDNIVSYSFDGDAQATVSLDYSYERFMKQGDYLFLMSYDRIDRINFNE